jgi:cathepsin X
MMQEIYQRGPIACGIAVTDEMENYTGGIFHDLSGDIEVTHEISIVGFGEEKGTPYWLIRNSWGEHWGEEGFMKLIRGKNNMGIESDCAWATPLDTWTKQVKHITTDAERNDPANNVKNGPFPIEAPVAEKFLATTPTKNQGCRRSSENYFKGGEKRPAVMSWDEVNPYTLPANYDWRNMNGTNFLSWNKNQHIPEYCGSCWSQGTTSSIADRFNIKFGIKTTPVALSAQVIVNCHAGGDCSGGEPGSVYEYAFIHGVPHASCEQYDAGNLSGSDGCQPIDICRDCTWPPCPAGQKCLDKCWAVDYKKHYVSSYYGVAGVDQMKAELFKNGPISCGIQATDKFETTYFGGIFRDYIAVPELNHEIAVVGWGLDEESGDEYWVGRNSWGTYWGEYGFFKVPIGEASVNMGIQTDCSAGIPSYDKHPSSPAPVEFIQ